MAPVPQQAEQLTLADLLGVLKRYRLVLAGIWIACVAIAVAAALLSAPVYRAEALVAAASDSSSAGGDLSSIISRFSSVPGMGALGKLSQRDTLAEGMVTLRSPQFLIEFIRAGNLKPVLFASQWDADKKTWLESDDGDVPTDEDAYIFFKEELLRVVEDKANPGILAVAIEWTDRQQAARWVNQLISRLNERLRTKAIDEANQTIEYLNKELEKARIVEVRQAIYFMIESQINLRTMANVREEFAFKVLSQAVVPDEDRYISPNRPFMVVMGFAVGFMLGVFACFLLFAFNRLRADISSQATSR